MSIKTTYTQCNRKMHDNYTPVTFFHNVMEHGLKTAINDEIEITGKRFHARNQTLNAAVTTLYFGSAAALAVGDERMGYGALAAGAGMLLYAGLDEWRRSRTPELSREFIENVVEMPKRSA